jgi:hypothetical protein
MAHAAIYVEDNPDGTISARMDFTGGYDNSSPAHQHIRLTMGMLDEVMQPAGEAEVEQNAAPSNRGLASKLIEQFVAMRNAADAERAANASKTLADLCADATKALAS